MGSLKAISNFAAKNGPEILTGLGVAGMIGATVLAVKGTPKAMKLIEQKKKRKGVKKLTAKEVIKTTWKCYIPAAITCVASATCIIGASAENVKRKAALAAACKLTETAFTEYREKVVEKVGEETEKEVRKAINEDRMQKDPVSKKDVIVTKGGHELCYDSFGRYFESSINTIEKAVNEINSRLLCFDYASLNDFYIELGLSPTDIGDDLGWNINEGKLEVEFDSQISDDGRPCIVISYNKPPVYEYSIIG